MRLYVTSDDAMAPSDQVIVRLFGRPGSTCSVGASARQTILRRGLRPSSRAWDFLAIALAVVAADHVCLRDKSPDGWTREIEMTVMVQEPDFWATQAPTLELALRFLTTDRWELRFVGGGVVPEPRKHPASLGDDCIVLLSGGLDSLIGASDLASAGRRPFAVSQVVRGDGAKQMQFAGVIGGGLTSLQLNHSVSLAGRSETSQRARSLIFLAFATATATSLSIHRDGSHVPVFLCENGFIALNPPLTRGRVGSLSTRTAHPRFLDLVQTVLDAAELRVKLVNPYRLRTKGEMLVEAREQELLRAYAARSTSCGRFQRHGYKQCGRCVPCQIRRASFLRWGVDDTTGYVYAELGKRNAEHAGFDDVRSVSMALAESKDGALDRWLGPTVEATLLPEAAELRAMVRRGLDELAALHSAWGVG
jgi:7-cyano-7-deazaguanine synthase in queuosine biosynthesis